MELFSEPVLVALALTAVAGLSTGIGGLMSMVTRASNTRFLSFALGLSGGVMVYVSLVDLLPECIAAFSVSYEAKTAQLISLAAFFAGVALIALIDFLIPEEENLHESHPFEMLEHQNGKRMGRTGLLLSLAIGVHNFPEGLATFASALENVTVALPIVVAIAIHNIPEGIAVAVPVLHSTGSRRKAFLASFASGMAEPLGAAFGALFLLPFWSNELGSLLLAFVAGIMVYISFDELLPSSERYGHHHFAISGVIAGMVIMAFGLVAL